MPSPSSVLLPSARALPTTPFPAITAQERVLAHLQHLYVDGPSDELLEGLVDALCAEGLRRIVLIAHGDANTAPDHVLYDPQTAPDWALPFARQYTGGVMPRRGPAESDTDYIQRARAAIVRPNGMLRGSPASFAIAIAPALTGSRLTQVISRYEGNLWRVAVITRARETEDPDYALSLVTDPAIVPAGVKVEHIASEGVTWDELAGITWDELTGVTWDDLQYTFQP